jgi:hypothetical protein
MRFLTTAIAAGMVLAAVSGAYAVPVTITNPGFDLSGDGVTPVDLSGNWVNLYYNWGTSKQSVLGWESTWFKGQNDNNESGQGEQWGGQAVLGDNGNARLVMSGNDWSAANQAPYWNNITIQAGTYKLGVDVTTNGHGYGGFSAAFESSYDNNLSSATIIGGWGDPNTGSIGGFTNFSGASDGGWSTVTAATLVVPEGSPLIGQRLGFELLNFSIQPDGSHLVNNAWLPPLLDNVTLDFAPAAVPEPASLGILAGAGLLALSRRRRSAN